VEKIPLNARSLAFRWNGLQYTLTIEEEHLRVNYRSAMYARCDRTSLESLSPELKYERWVPASAWQNGKEARYLLLLAVVVYFSKLHEFVPLLAPVALAMSWILAYRAARAASPVTKTQVRTEDNDDVVSIPHFNRLAQQHQSFEEALTRQIKAAKGDAAE
jgi:hypothetical protein